MKYQVGENDEELHKLMELPWAKSFILLMRKPSLNNLFNENRQYLSAFLQKYYAAIADYTLLDPFRLENIIRLLSRVTNVPGDIIECGCYKGGAGLLMGLWLHENKVQKKIFLFDSFEGLPEPDAKLDKGYTKGQFTANLDALTLKIKELDLQDIVVPVKGWFKDTVPPFLNSHPAMQYSLFHVDCDLYESTRDCFPSLLPAVAGGGIVILDDFNDGARGEKRAVLEYLQPGHTIEAGPASQAYFVKVNSNNAGIDYSFDELMQNQPYLNWLRAKTGVEYKEMVLGYLNTKDV